MTEQTPLNGVVSHQTTTASKTKKWKWRYQTPPNLTLAQETVFLNMQIRKTGRALSGTKSRNTTYEFVALAVLLVIIYSVGASSREHEDLAKDSQFFVTLTLGQVVAIGIWLYVAAFVTATFSESRFIELLYWMCIYLPLLAMMLSFLFDTNHRVNSELNYLNYGQVVGVLLIVSEGLALAIFLCIFYAYPSYINSNAFRRKRRTAGFWQIKVLSDWTISYLSKRSFFRTRYTCKYQGETNKDGLPHGIGRWFDDSTDGEILTGAWKDGVPVAPFFSRHYGRGDVFSAVRIAYVMASDDDFESAKFWPTNNNPPRCGIGSVECSVSGHFYNELPCASQLMEETPFDEETSVETLFRELKDIGHTESEHHNMLFIKANDPRGIQIQGHVHSVTGKSFNKLDEIHIKVRPVIPKPNSFRPRPQMDFMPYSTRHIHVQNDMIAVREDESEQFRDESGSVRPPVVRLVPMAPVNEGEEETKEVEIESALSNNSTQADVQLTVENWIPAKHKDALVFLAGFNCGLKEALQGFGQFIAMTKLDSEIYPILFGWPCGQVLTYHSASRVSHREQNKRNFLSLMKSLQNAGIRNVHLMSHSMGVQTLVGSFCDNEDGSRSDVSRCFKLAPGWDEGKAGKNASGENEQTDEDDNLLVCKTLTMLNPDYTLDSFVNHAFKSIRRICGTITIVGDRTDGALFFSQLMNGIGVYFGYKQPPELQPNERNKKKLRYQYVVGRSIESLYLPDDISKDNENDCMVFSERAPLTLVSEDRDLDKMWLDLDVIDTSGLDTNIANIRHSAFNLNPILLNDLEELIKTNQRAMKRSSLLYRDGNIFSYCHAPSYVAY